MPRFEALIEPLEIDRGVTWLGLCAVPRRPFRAARFAAYLSDDERAVASSISFQPKADEYLVSRWLARAVAGRILDLEPRQVPLSAPRGCAPSIGADAWLSMSHSNGMVLAASSERRVAVDVESEGEHLIRLCERFVRPAAEYSIEDATRRWVAWEAQRKLGEAVHLMSYRRARTPDGTTFGAVVALGRWSASVPRGIRVVDR